MTQRKKLMCDALSFAGILVNPNVFDFLFPCFFIGCVLSPYFGHRQTVGFIG
jgi:hypothetical protein